MTNALKVEFQNNALASQFKDKKVDIYGISFANNCIGLIEDKTSCMYGGITIHDNNYYYDLYDFKGKLSEDFLDFIMII